MDPRQRILLRDGEELGQEHPMLDLVGLFGDQFLGLQNRAVGLLGGHEQLPF